MLRMNWLETSEPSSHPGIGTANPPVRLTQEQSFHAAGYEGEHIRQVCMLAHQLGFPLPNEVAYGIWNWEKLWKECGAPGGPGCDS